MKLLAALLVIVAFIGGYWLGYEHAYQPLHHDLQTANDKLQNIQAEDWQLWNKQP